MLALQTLQSLDCRQRHTKHDHIVVARWKSTGPQLFCKFNLVAAREFPEQQDRLSPGLVGHRFDFSRETLTADADWTSRDAFVFDFEFVTRGETLF